MKKVNIDFVTNNENGSWSLVHVLQGPWDIEDRLVRLQELQGVMYDYVDALLDNEVVKLYPESRGKDFIIKISCYSIEKEHVEDFFKKFSRGIFMVPEYKEALDRNKDVASISFDISFD